MRAMTLLLCLSMGLAACGAFKSSSSKVTFDGHSFRGSAKSVNKADRRDFVAVTGPVSRSLAGAREAVRHEGTKYCIRWFGVSDIDWRIAPDAEALPIENDKIVLTGRCVE